MVSIKNILYELAPYTIRVGTLKLLRALKLTLRKILFHRLCLELPCAWFQSVGPAVWAPGQSMGRLYAIKVTIKESTFNSMDCSELYVVSIMTI